ncbi:MAG: endonuclease domain-containing protein [Gemmatimonadota bacterium]
MRDEPRKGFLGPGHYWPAKIEAARRLRREATPAERTAWEFLRRNGIRGHYFRRQVVVEGFIVDFFCAKLRLVIELDGAVHDAHEQAAYDRERDLVLTRRGLRVVRLCNDEVSRHRLEAIALEHEDPLPRQGEG